MALLGHQVISRALRVSPVSLRTYLIVLLFGCLSNAVVRAQPGEYDLKAAFLYHFTHFVEWPPEAFSTTNSPIIIGVLGSNPFGSTLRAVVRDEKVRGRPIEVKTYPNAFAAREAHILFISRSEENNVSDILRILGTRAILTVSDMDSFAQNGGIIRFRTDDNRVRLRINHQNAREKGLVLSSKLLRVAEVIESN